jgi:hypothetical protein
MARAEDDTFATEYHERALAGLKRVMAETKKVLSETGPQYRDYMLIPLSGAMTDFQGSIAIKAQEHIATDSDFEHIHGNYGDSTRIKIKNLGVQNLLEQNFEYFNATALFTEEKVANDNSRLEAVLVPINSFSLNGEGINFSVYYSNDTVSPVFTKDPFEGKNKLEKALAVSEILMWIDSQVDAKLQTPVAA